MTAKQKAARLKFKKVVAEAKKLRAKNPKLTQAQAVKQAWAIDYGKKRAEKVAAAPKKKAVKKAAKKKSAAKSYHKDTASHNVRISVVSGIAGMKTAAKKLLSEKYGDLAAKKLTEKTKRGKKKIQKEMNEIAAKIRKVVNI